jgi:hypothetical protein
MEETGHTGGEPDLMVDARVDEVRQDLVRSQHPRGEK